MNTRRVTPRAAVKSGQRLKCGSQRTARDANGGKTRSRRTGKRYGVSCSGYRVKGFGARCEGKGQVFIVGDKRLHSDKWSTEGYDSHGWVLGARCEGKGQTLIVRDNGSRGHRRSHRVRCSVLGARDKGSRGKGRKVRGQRNHSQPQPLQKKRCERLRVKG